MKLKFLFLLVFIAFTSCSSEDHEPDHEVANVEVELIHFDHEVDTENQTELVEFEIKFTNKSSFDVKGAPKISYRRMNDPEVTYTRAYTLDELPCTSLASGAVCTFSYKNVENYNTEIFGPDGPAELQIASAEYVIIEEFR